MCRSLLSCCARAASGQAVADPAIALIKSRRRIARPQAQDYVTRQLQQGTALGGMRFRVTLQSSNPEPTMFALGHFERPGRCPLCPRKRLFAASPRNDAKCH